MRLLTLAAFAAAVFSIVSCKGKPATEAQKAGANVNQQAPYYSNVVPDESPVITHKYDSNRVEMAFPFIIYNDDTYLIAVDPSDTSVFRRFNPIFEKYTYSGNGYSWDGIIREVLKKQDEELIKHLDFRADATGFYAFADGPTSQRKAARLLSETFNNRPALEEYFRNTKRSKIND